MGVERDRVVLRALQVADEVFPFAPVERRLLIRELSRIGRRLGLECTGVHEGGGYYDHSGATCPIHEWLEKDWYEIREDRR